jgi:cytochrome c-type biogenesis protein CcmE
VRKRLQICLVVLIVVGFVGLLVFLAQGHTISVLEPKGVIADKQRNLNIQA